MVKFIIGYFVVQLLLLIIVLFISNKTDKKRKKKYVRPNEIPEGFIKTKESFLDTKTKNMIYVYYNPKSGQRIYVEH